MSYLAKDQQYLDPTLTGSEQTVTRKKTITKNVRCFLTIIILACVLLLFAATITPALTGDDIIDTAEQYLGYPYRYQSAGPDAFDCGGFVWYVFQQVGVDLKYRSNSAALSEKNLAIFTKEELLAGDIVFFGSSVSSISHWGIYAGDGQVIHSYNEGTGVVYTPLDSIIPGFAYACRINALVDHTLYDENSYLTTEELPWLDLPTPQQTVLVKRAFSIHDLRMNASESSTRVERLSALLATISADANTISLFTEAGISIESLPMLLCAGDDVLAQNLITFIESKAMSGEAAALILTAILDAPTADQALTGLADSSASE